MDLSHIHDIAENLKPEKSTRYKVGYVLGTIIGVAIVLSFDAIILLLLFKAFGFEVLFWPCFFLAFIVQYFATKFK